MSSFSESVSAIVQFARSRWRQATLFVIVLTLSDVALTNGFPPLVNLTLTDQTQSENIYESFELLFDNQPTGYSNLLDDLDGDGRDDFVFISGEGTLCTELIVLPSSLIDSTNINPGMLELAIRYTNIPTLLNASNADCLRPQLVENIGDLNADGVSDLWVQTIDINGYAEPEYTNLILFGRTEPARIDVISASKGIGFILDSGQVGAAGDVNGDGADDIVITDYTYSMESNTSTISVLAGSGTLDDHAGINSSPDLQRLFSKEYEDGFVLLAQSGDLNGDGFDDLQLISFTSKFSTSIIYGQSRFDNNPLQDTDASTEDSMSLCKSSFCLVSPAGDIDADGYEDVFLSILPFSDGNDDAGSNFQILFGSAQGLEVEDLSRSRVTIIHSGLNEDFFPSIALAGDINGDSIADIAISGDSQNFYILYGREQWPDTIDLTTLNGVSGFQIAAGENWSVYQTKMFDLDRDGIEDIVFFENNAGAFLKGRAVTSPNQHLENLRVAFAQDAVAVRWDKPAAGSSINRVDILAGETLIASVQPSTGFQYISYEQLQGHTTLSVNTAYTNGTSSLPVQFDIVTERYLISSVRAEVYTANTLELFWQSGAGPFNVWRDGELLSTVDGNSYLDTSVIPGESYSYWVTLEPNQNNGYYFNDDAFDDFYITDDSYYSVCDPFAGSFDFRSYPLRQYAPRTSEVLTILTGSNQFATTIYPPNGSQSQSSCDPTYISTPTIRSAEIYSETSAELFWERSESFGYQVLNYEVLRDDQVVANTNGLSFFDSDLKAGRSYIYTVTAVAPDGTRSGSDSVVVTIGSFEVRVENGTIYWPDNGWYEVQNQDDYASVCEGGQSCTADPGNYLVINHTTGERFDDIQVLDVGSNNTDDEANVVSVNGLTINWPDNGWYQVQRSDNYETVCEGTSSCVVEPGSYNVINHTTGERYDRISVVSGEAVDSVTVNQNVISWPDNGDWYQVQNADDYSSICDGGLSCSVAAGRYIVINHKTGIRTEVEVTQ